VLTEPLNLTQLAHYKTTVLSEENSLLAVRDLTYKRIKLLGPRYRFSCFPKLLNSSPVCPVVPFVSLGLVISWLIHRRVAQWCRLLHWGLLCMLLPLCLKTSKMAGVDDVSNDASWCRQRSVGYLLVFLN